MPDCKQCLIKYRALVKALTTAISDGVIAPDTADHRADYLRVEKIVGRNAEHIAVKGNEISQIALCYFADPIFQSCGIGWSLCVTENRLGYTKPCFRIPTVWSRCTVGPAARDGSMDTLQRHKRFNR